MFYGMRNAIHYENINGMKNVIKMINRKGFQSNEISMHSYPHFFCDVCDATNTADFLVSPKDVSSASFRGGISPENIV